MENFNPQQNYGTGRVEFRRFWHSLPEDSILLRFDASSLHNRIPTFRRNVLVFLSSVNTARLQAVIVFDTSVSDYPLKQYNIPEDRYTQSMLLMMMAVVVIVVLVIWVVLMVTVVVKIGFVLRYRRF